MQTLDEPQTMPDDLAPLNQESLLPGDGDVQHIAFVTSEPPGATTLFQVAEPIACRVVTTAAPLAVEETIATLSLLCIESEDHGGGDLTAHAWQWVEPGVEVERRQGMLITLQGTRVIWCAGRAALIAPARRLVVLHQALVEFALHEALVRKMEQKTSAGWPELAADGPHAFHFDDRSAQQRERLAQRFQEVLELRMRLVRLLPVLERPSVHPPTVASQLAERLKERARLVERVEHLSEQVEVYERIYELCGQRSSDYLIALRSNTLEWIIIVLLATETIVLLVDLLSSLGTS